MNNKFENYEVFLFRYIIICMIPFLLTATPPIIYNAPNLKMRMKKKRLALSPFIVVK